MKATEFNSMFSKFELLLPRIHLSGIQIQPFDRQMQPNATEFSLLFVPLSFFPSFHFALKIIERAFFFRSKHPNSSQSNRLHLFSPKSNLKHPNSSQSNRFHLKSIQKHPNSSQSNRLHPNAADCNRMRTISTCFK